MGLLDFLGCVSGAMWSARGGSPALDLWQDEHFSDNYQFGVSVLILNPSMQFVPQDLWFVVLCEFSHFPELFNELYSILVQVRMLEMGGNSYSFHLPWVDSHDCCEIYKSRHSSLQVSTTTKFG
jgi:hypothetical protein